MDNCNVCDYKLENHYGLFCPRCNVDKLEIKGTRVFDMVKVMHCMEANGFIAKDKFWEYLYERKMFRNDTYFDLCVEWYDEHEEEIDEINSYYKNMASLLNIKNGERAILKMSW